MNSVQVWEGCGIPPPAELKRIAGVERGSLYSRIPHPGILEVTCISADRTHLNHGFAEVRITEVVNYDGLCCYDIEIKVESVSLLSAFQREQDSYPMDPPPVTNKDKFQLKLRRTTSMRADGTYTLEDDRYVADECFVIHSETLMSVSGKETFVFRIRSSQVTKV